MTAIHRTTDINVVRQDSYIQGMHDGLSEAIETLRCHSGQENAIEILREVQRIRQRSPR